MSNILFIVGLPGSGKSTLSKKINKDNDGKYLIIDDPKNFELDIQPHLDRDLIITDPQLCFEKNRKKAEERIKSISPDVEIDWICDDRR
jgi:adenylate kinase family enzyme